MEKWILMILTISSHSFIREKLNRADLKIFKQNIERHSTSIHVAALIFMRRSYAHYEGFGFVFCIYTV